MGSLFQKVFFFWTFCGRLFMFTENWNKTGEMTAKMCFLYYYYYCDSLYIKCIIQLFFHGLELKTKTK